MIRFFNTFVVTILACCLFLLSFPSQMGASSQVTTSASPSAQSSNPKSATKKSGGASASDIAAAKASGKVWVNTDTGVYHKNGRWYGKTKTGKFMTEAEAKAAGYKEAKNQ